MSQNNNSKGKPAALSGDFKGSPRNNFGAWLSPAQQTTTQPVKQEKSILKVAVLSEPYFPKQKLSVRFN